MQITQWDGENSNKRFVLHIKLDMARKELKELEISAKKARHKVDLARKKLKERQFLVREARDKIDEVKDKIYALEEEFSSIPFNNCFSTKGEFSAAQ